MITALYASILGCLWGLLTFYVVLGRWKYRVSLGDGDTNELHRRIRAHANFVETVPLALLLLWIGEVHIFTVQWVHTFGILLVLGRLLHAYGMLVPKYSTNRFRQTGMTLTIAMVVGGSVWTLWTMCCIGVV